MRPESIASFVRVPHDGRVQPIPQILEIALEGGTRDAERIEKYLDRYDPPLVEELIYLVEAFGSVHVTGTTLPSWAASSTVFALKWSSIIASSQ